MKHINFGWHEIKTVFSLRMKINLHVAIFEKNGLGGFSVQ